MDNYMKSSQEFQKALLLLDYGKIEKGEEKLKYVISQAESENDDLTLVRALVCLGDLLSELGKNDEARIFLTKALSYKRDDDVLAYEFNRAAELLSLNSH